MSTDGNIRKRIPLIDVGVSLAHNAELPRCRWPSVAEVPELPGCIAHGDTQEAALAHASEAIQLWVETGREFGDPIPEPKGERLMLA